MPKEYMECVKSEMKGGKSKKTAQRMCAISYYKRHGRTPMQDEHKASAEVQLEITARVLAMMFDEIERVRNTRK